MPTAPSVVVRDQRGAAMAGVPVTFTVSAGGGNTTTTAAMTDVTGGATPGVWTLGRSAGTNTMIAQASGGANPSATISATARLPYWTLMVYLAADNTLTVDGLKDIDELEVLGANPEVQVVVQAEFSPVQFAFYGVTPASQHLPNFNTIRYSIPATGGVKTGFGPDGIVQDIGNVDMTNPATLRAFVQWAAQNYPAERTALVLWNHGGGYTGLIEDVTSAGSRFMSVSELQSGLTGMTLDVVDFDMCLMAGYETLQKIQGIAKTAVFSEELAPGPGNPYDKILGQWYAQPTMTAQQVATTFVEQFHASYLGTRSSTTLSAFDMSGFSAFESALNALATSLRVNIAAYRQTLAAFLPVSQRYAYSQLADLGDVLDSLNSRVGDATLRTQITAVRSALSSTGFRLRSLARTGTESEANDVGRSSGMHVLLPTGTLVDFLPSTGPASLAAYRAQWGSTAWATFVESWLAGTQASPFRDLGTTRWEVYVVWDTTSVRRGADLDLWVLEPNGNIFIPYLGTVTPNGRLTGESFNTRAYYEGFLMNRYAQIGRYKFYADLWTDPADVRPLVDVQFRSTESAAFSSLYAPNYPRLSKQASWRNDPNASLARIEAGLYSDLRQVSFLDITAGVGASLRDALPPSSPSMRMQFGRTEAEAPEISSAQWRLLRRLRDVRLRRDLKGVEKPVLGLNAPPRRQ
ncbi:MAG: clostripain-related cysteine peptidase [Chloroflexota bacterium]